MNQNYQPRTRITNVQNRDYFNYYPVRHEDARVKKMPECIVKLGIERFVNKYGVEWNKEKQ